ncbi:PREDICTED: guanine nucleotide exchange factor MSS4 homolog [Polistes canadensis]|uniref:guanine nucleotide exchange factor MSS4 homolog n=1 Tax=Polistes canadensis TaxID=91411 RepID=UPI000719036F|nr:PREDICTED: guanine nucleotide exchange factor MSS4 homolog [Polistes canadensis]
MSTNENSVNTKTYLDGKNKEKLFCNFCSSKILNAETATFITMEFALPHIHSKGEGEGIQQETITEYWYIEDMFAFENIGVSHTVGNIKYLACADCERGPVGWHDLATKKSYIALSRVKHVKF